MKTPAGEIVAEFDLRGSPGELAPRYNIAPTQEVLALVAGPDAGLRAGWLRWGLVPFWAKDPAIGNRLINARAETLTEKPAFRESFEKRRCLIVADGFYEWRRWPGGKQPYRIRRRDERPFAFAALWAEWGPRATRLRTCAIVTTRPNELLRPIHDRMPVVLAAGAREAWLREDRAERLVDLLGPCAAAELEAYEVSTVVNSPANDGPECAAPLSG